MSRENGSHGFFGLDDKDGISEQFSAPDGLEGSGFDSSGERRDEFERAYGKRIKMMGPNQQNVTPLNLSEEFTPLGLTLRKTPSFLDLIEMKLSQPTGASPVEPSRSINYEMTRLRSNDSNSQPIAEKLKASNFPVSLLKIGSWERVCHYEGDLVAKCYFAKRKLVWEVLHSGLKNKIEFQWSDISAIRASYSENARGILEIELNNTPMFFRETTPQPRKHTLWQATSDFTGGQASIYRRHYLQFPEGTLQKHYEKLLQCDGRLHLLSRKPFPTLSSPYISFFGGSQGLSYEPSIQVPGFTTGFNLNFKDSSGSQFPRYSIGRSAPTQQISNFELLRPTISNNAFNSPCTVPDFPHIERLDIKEQEQHGIPFWDGIDNQEVIGNTRETQLPETSSICSANQIASFLPREMSPSCLLSSNTPNLFSSKNWELNKIAEQLLNEPSACTSSNEQMILRRLNSMQTLLSSADMNLGVDNLGILHEDQDLEKSSDDSVISKSPFSTDDGGYPCSNFMSRLPVQRQPENLLNHPPQNAPFPYWFTDQSAEDFVNEPKTEWNKWR